MKVQFDRHREHPERGREEKKRGKGCPTPKGSKKKKNFLLILSIIRASLRKGGRKKKNYTYILTPASLLDFSARTVEKIREKRERKGKKRGGGGDGRRALPSPPLLTSSSASTTYTF